MCQCYEGRTGSVYKEIEHCKGGVDRKFALAYHVLTSAGSGEFAALVLPATSLDY